MNYRVGAHRLVDPAGGSLYQLCCNYSCYVLKNVWRGPWQRWSAAAWIGDCPKLIKVTNQEKNPLDKEKSCWVKKGRSWIVTKRELNREVPVS